MRLNRKATLKTSFHLFHIIVLSQQKTIEEDKESKRILNELWKEGQELKKQVIDGLVFGVADFSEVKPGQKYEPSAFFSKQFIKKKEIHNRVKSFSVSSYLEISGSRKYKIHLTFYVYRLKLRNN